MMLLFLRKNVWRLKIVSFGLVFFFVLFFGSNVSAVTKKAQVESGKKMDQTIIKKTVKKTEKKTIVKKTTNDKKTVLAPKKRAFHKQQAS